MGVAATSRFVLSHKLLVGIAWLVIAAAGFASTGPATGALSERFDLPGSESTDTNGAIAATYSNGGEAQPLVAFLTLPLKAVILNVLSVGAAYGVMVLVWQEGYGSELIWGIEPTGAIAAFVPILAFSFLFGLSMDDEVFILTRMREEYDATGSTDAAVIRGIGRTARLVTATPPDTIVKTMATGLAAGIFLDATVVRALLVPATVSLMGRWN